MSATETSNGIHAWDDKTDDKNEAVAKSEPMTIAVSANILFNMKEQKEGKTNKKKVFKPGVAFPFVKALLAVSSCFHKLYPDTKPLFNVILMSISHAQEKHLKDSLNEIGFSQILVHQDDYISKLNQKTLYLSEDTEKVENAINNGHPAAIMFPNDKESQWSEEGELRVVFDGDGVLFSDESEIVFKKKGLEAYIKNENDSEDIPLGEGPLKCFLEALVNMEKKFHAKGLYKNCPVQTYLVTSRDPVISGTRVLKTLKSWGVEITQAFFLSGRAKGPLLEMIRPHIFFDDQKPHIDGAIELGVSTAHVPYGIGYETYKSAANKH